MNNPFKDASAVFLAASILSAPQLASAQDANHWKPSYTGQEVNDYARKRAIFSETQTAPSGEKIHIVNKSSEELKRSNEWSDKISHCLITAILSKIKKDGKFSVVSAESLYRNLIVWDNGKDRLEGAVFDISPKEGYAPPEAIGVLNVRINGQFGNMLFNDRLNEIPTLTDSSPAMKALLNDILTETKRLCPTPVASNTLGPKTKVAATLGQFKPLV